MKDKTSRRKQVMTAASIIYIIIIFLNSIQTGSASSKQSGSIVMILQGLLDSMGLNVTVSSFIVRKTAHFIEFAVLGVLLGVTLRTYTIRIFAYIFTQLFIGLSVAVTDEFIQLFCVGRAGMVQDIVLDFTGFLTGLGITIILYIIKMRK
jgi:VanZ family protein